MRRAGSVARVVVTRATLPCGAVWLVVGVCVAAAQLPPVPRGVTASPGDPKVTLRVGETGRFRVDAAGDGLAWRWTLDARAVGSAPQWSFVPTADDVGRHEVAVSVTGPAGTVRRRWQVRVTEPRPPRIVEASPAAASLSTPAESVVRLHVRAEATGRDETVAIAWTVDGVLAGEGETLRWRATRPGVAYARALATGSLGAAVAREWRITVTPLPTTTTTLPSRAAADGEAGAEDDDGEAGEVVAGVRAPPPLAPPRTPAAPPTTLPARAVAPPATTVPVRSVPTTTVAPPATTLPPPARTAPPPAEDRRLAARPPTSPPATSGAIEAAAVRTLLDRYAAAWRARDVGELQRLGQVNSEAQAEALRKYFAEADDLEVEIDVLEIDTTGDRATVRFRRRDRFRNPAGEVTTQQSPPIEKPVVRAPDGGLRFGTAAR